MTEDSLVPFDLPAVSRKKVTADFAGGLISADGGLVVLREAEHRLGLSETLAGCIREWRDPERVVHALPGDVAEIRRLQHRAYPAAGKVMGQEEGRAAGRSAQLRAVPNGAATEGYEQEAASAAPAEGGDQTT